jgi:hypothetical protein
MEEILAWTDGAMGKCAGIRFMAGHVTPPSLSSPLTSRQVEGGEQFHGSILDAAYFSFATLDE